MNSIQNTIKKINFRLLFVWIAVIILAIFLRFWHLGSIPAGQHQDEAWFAYNAFLLKTTGANIYGEHLPLTIDMWGDYVSSFHSFAIVPFITIFGMSTMIFRAPFVTASIGCLFLAAWLLYRWTNSKTIPILFAFFFATSQWNIIMSRASSTVVLDSLVTLISLTAFYETIRFLSHKARPAWQYVLLSLVTYFFTIVNYFTYFTSRLPLPVFLVVILLLSWYQLKLSKRVILAGSLIIFAYCIFPFAIMLKTPYALGRYNDTTVINSGLVRNQIFLDITRSGQGRFPAPITHLFYNKVTENARAIAVQYSVFFSPSVVLFQTSPPARYFVPQAGVVNIIEYLGLILAAASLVLAVRPELRSWRATALSVFVMTAAALVPTALTVDDWPNFQRGVFVTPFWQMTAAVGWGITITQMLRSKPSWLSGTFLRSLFIFIIVGGVLLSLAPFTLSYFVQSPYANIYSRSRAGEKLGAWINAEAHDATILMDHNEANFIYPYLYAHENIRATGLNSPEKYILKTSQFQIGKRYFVSKLCDRPDLLSMIKQIHPDMIIVKVDPPYTPCSIPTGYQATDSFSYDDGTIVYHVYQYHPEWKDPVEEVKH